MLRQLREQRSNKMAHIVQNALSEVETRRPASVGTVDGGAVVSILPGIGALDREIWDEFFPGDGECWNYYRAAEAAMPAGFAAGAILVSDGSRPLAAAPLFRTAHQLHASLQGRAREVVDRLARPFPRLLQVPVLGLGSPLLDRCHIGFARALDESQRTAALGILLRALERQATRERASILAVKDLHDSEMGPLDQTLRSARFGRMASLPVVQLDLPFRSEAQYLASLPEGTASYLKRKMRALAKVRVEHPSSIHGIEDQIQALYDATRLNSHADYGDFEQLHPDYFASIMERCGDKARMMLCWHGDTLASFQLYLAGEREVVAKYIGMRYPLARELNLYFINWMAMIRFAIERGIPRIRMGNTSYAVKLMFGGRLERSWLYFRHRNPAVNLGFRLAAPLMDYERNDPELKRLAKAGNSPG